MRPHRLAVILLLCLTFPVEVFAQRKAPTGGRLAVVVDERLSALRVTPQLNGKLVRRLGRGRLVAVRSVKTNSAGVTFFFVNVTTRTRGWIQRESVVSPSRAGDDHRLFTLIRNSHGFDRIARSRIFLDHFRRSSLRPAVLLLIGDTAEEVAPKLIRNLKSVELEAPESTYYLNHPTLDRYNRQNVHFIFNSSTKRFHYDGAAWRLLLRNHANTPEAIAARQRLQELAKHSP